MRLAIDNLDGLGAVDYTAALDRSEPLEIVRSLNAPSTARGLLCLVGTSLRTPVRRARIVLANDAGTLLFTGYLTVEPVPLYAGEASAGTVYRLAFTAVSDEWLLDRQASLAGSGGAVGSYAGAVLTGLLDQLGPAIFSTAGVAQGNRIGVFDPAAVHAAGTGAGVSAVLGAAAGATYSAYRVLNGAMTLATAGSVAHSFSDGDGSLALAALRTASVRELANDVTVTGAMEPAAYWTEIFAGDGATAAFAVTGEPTAPNAAHAVLVADRFNMATLNPARWATADPGSHLALGPGGLTLTGGNGVDGGTTLVATTPIEMGGTLVVELTDVLLNPASAGVLGGLYGGTVAQANCLAGFNVSQAGGNTVVQPLVAGALAGTPFTIVAGHAYTLRLHLHCAELLRSRQVYYARAEVQGVSQVQSFGGGPIDAPLAVVCEIRDQGMSSNTSSTILYDGMVANSYAAPSLAAVNSVQLFGSVGSVSVTRTGTAWVRSTDPVTGTVSTRLAGQLYGGVDCTVSSSVTGTVTFLPGRIPVAGETITVQYRGQRRAVGRLADAASLAAEAAGGGPGTARWLGHVVSPVARSAEDCENAAQAILAFATDRAAAVSGTYVAVNPAANGDLWPGDVLVFTTANDAVNAIARKVTILEKGAAPEALTYRIAFANDWAEALGLQLSEAMAKDALLPETPLTLAPGQTPANPQTTLANLSALAVTAFTGTGASQAMTVDAGTDPPPGGGFEVRRRDGGFGTGNAGPAGELVLRTPTRGFQIPRAAFEEHFFIRMYDASTPPLYSRESAAVVTHMAIA